MIRNASNISLPMALWLITDFYDHAVDPMEISATTLLKPIREIILSRRQVPGEEGDTDISSRIASSLGTAIHMNIEAAWKHPDLLKNLIKLGVPEQIAKKIMINHKNPPSDSIPVYMEIRGRKQVGAYTVSGKFDFCIEKGLTDFKSGKVYGWINGSNTEKYRKQGSIYRWLHPEIITKDTMNIDYFFVDWTALGAKTQKKYPPSQIMTETLSLMSIQETENFVQERIALIAQHEQTPQENLPRCNDDELWRSPPTFKYYKNPKSKARSTKNFDSMGEAMVRLHADGGVGIVDEVKSKVVACRYCNALNSCTQAEHYVLSGELEL